MDKIRKALMDGYRNTQGVPFWLSDKEKVWAYLAGFGMTVISFICVLAS